MTSKLGKVCSFRKLSKNESEKLAELFRTDLISNMKIADAEPLDNANLCRITDPWRHDWNCGVQVPINSDDDITRPALCLASDLSLPGTSAGTESLSFAMQYDLDLLDEVWLTLLNKQLQKIGLSKLSQNAFELAMEQLELAAHGKSTPTDKSPNTVDSDDTVCDVCRSPTWEDGNQIVFCDNCNVGVHQMCYGVKRIPKGAWFCRPCSLGFRPKCLLCPNRGGAMKSSRSCDKWVHVSCALWVPEIVFENKETMEPATNLNNIPESRFALRCSLCTNRGGACIQCNQKACRSAYHVTCAQKHGLQLLSIPKFESYCLKHADFSRDQESPVPPKYMLDMPTTSDDAKEWLTNLRPYFLRTLLNVPQYTAESVFYYWRLKKFSGFGKPGIRLTDSDKAIERQHEEHLIRRVQLLMFLRQNMEKARNLCYMIERREKLKRQEYVAADDQVRFMYQNYDGHFPRHASSVAQIQPILHIKSEYWNNSFTRPDFFRRDSAINGVMTSSIFGHKTTHKNQRLPTPSQTQRRAALKSLDLNKLNNLKSASKSFVGAQKRRSVKHAATRKYDYLKRRHANKIHALHKMALKQRHLRADDRAEDGASSNNSIDIESAKRTRRAVVHFSPV